MNVPSKLSSFAAFGARWSIGARWSLAALLALAIASASPVWAAGAAAAAPKKSEAKAPAAKKSEAKAPAAKKSGGKSTKAKKAPESDELPPYTQRPWDLRDHYTFTFDKATFIYAVDNGHWHLELPGAGEVVRAVTSTITLGDGTVVDVADFGPGDSRRVKVTTELGNATEYRQKFPAKNGIEAVHIFVVYKDRPFFTVGIEITNAGTAPIELAKLSPLVMPAGSLASLNPVTVRTRRLAPRGPFTVPDFNAPPLTALFYAPSQPFALGLAFMGTGDAASGIAVQSAGNGWQAEATCSYAPGLKLEPGQTVKSDPVWVSFNLADPTQVEMVYAWAHGQRTKPETRKALPPCWVTVQDDAPQAALMAAATAWAPLGVHHALVPAGWMGRGGEGSRWPKNMGRVAQELRGAKMAPGLTIDPLIAESSEAPGTVASADGQRWINPATPEGHEAGLKRAKQFAEWNFDFYVVAPSAIPDDALKQMNLPRARADALAFELILAAANGKPVFPSAAAGTALGGELESWLEAAGATAEFGRCGALAGPIRLDASRLSSAISEDTLQAMAFCGGPIEFLAERGGSAPRGMKAFAPLRGASAVPYEVAQQPRLWLMWGSSSETASPSRAVAAFPGGSAWDPAGIALTGGGDTRVYRAINAGFEEVSGRPVPAATAFTVYNVLKDAAGPVVFSAGLGPRLAVLEARDVKWDQAKSVLSGSIVASVGGTTACVFVPAGWEFRSGKIGQGEVAKPKASGLLAMQMPADRAPFELAFKQAQGTPALADTGAQAPPPAAPAPAPAPAPAEQPSTPPPAAEAAKPAAETAKSAAETAKPAAETAKPAAEKPEESATKKNEKPAKKAAKPEAEKPAAEAAPPAPGAPEATPALSEGEGLSPAWQEAIRQRDARLAAEAEAQKKAAEPQGAPESAAKEDKKSSKSLWKRLTGKDDKKK